MQKQYQQWNKLGMDNATNKEKNKLQGFETVQKYSKTQDLRENKERMRLYHRN